jgi:poly-beta-1,6-N-acetyl-D-glucosamine N-deacetylase
MTLINRSLRSICTWLFANILILLGFVRRAKAGALRGDYVLSVYFHNPSLKEFERCVKWLKNNNFKFLSSADLHQIIEKKLPLPAGTVILTADDGWQSNQKNIAQVAERHQIPVTIFVATDPVEQGSYWWSYVEEAQRRNIPTPTIEQLKSVPNDERLYVIEKLRHRIDIERGALTVNQVKAISASTWITIGGHTASHPILNNCSDLQVLDELHQSREKLKAWTGREIDFFAYPNGDYTPREIQVLQELGYKMAFTVQPDFLTQERLRYNFELPRFEVIEGASFAEAICRMTGVWEPVMLSIRRMLRIKRNKSHTSVRQDSTKPVAIPTLH